MEFQRVFFVAAMLFSLGSVNLAAQQTQSVLIRFEPLAWSLKEPGPGLDYTKYDFPALLRPDAPWQTAASRVQVLEVPGNVIWSYPDLPGLIAFLKRYHFKFALSDGMLFSNEACSKGVEGMSEDADVNRETVTIARKWKAAGGTLDYVDMDSPFFYGVHYDKGCRYSIPEVARRTAATLAGMRAYFPNVHIIDAEGPGLMTDDTWISELSAWFDEFHRAAGVPVEELELDLHWATVVPGQTWLSTTRRVAPYFQRSGMRVGLIINADGKPGMTDAQWMDDNRQHIRDAATGNLGLDFILFSSWMDHPARNLPESDPNAYTSLIDYAAQQIWK